MKKVIAGISAFAILTTMGASALASTPKNNTNTNKQKTTITQCQEKGKRPALTDEQKAKMKEQKNKFASLTDAQKAELTAENDKIKNIEVQIIDKYVSFNVISEQTATDIKTRMTSKDNKFCGNGLMPMGPGFDEGHRGMMKPVPAANVAANTTTNKQAKAEKKRPELTDEQKAAMKEKMKSAEKNRPELTDEQKAEMQARQAEMKAMKEKLAALTDEQKAEIYALQDQIFEIRAQIVDKLLSWNVIDEKTATDMKAKLTEQATKMREEGKLPMMGGFEGRGKCGHKGAPSTTKK